MQCSLSGGLLLCSLVAETKAPSNQRHSQLHQWKKEWRACSQTGLAASKADLAFLPPFVPPMSKSSYLLQCVHREQLSPCLQSSHSCRNLPRAADSDGTPEAANPKVHPEGTCLCRVPHALTLHSRATSPW